MVSGMTVNGLGEVAALTEVTNSTSSLLGLGKQLTHYLILGTNSLSFRYRLSIPALPVPFSYSAVLVLVLDPIFPP